MTEEPKMASVRSNGNQQAQQVGTVRVSARDRTFSKYFVPGDIAVIDVADVDRKFASDLMLLRPSAVLNAKQSTTGRGPSLGAQDLVASGITVVDDLGSDLADLREGDEVTVTGADVYRNGTLIASGIERTEEDVRKAGTRGRERLGAKVRAFATAGPEHFARDEVLIVDGVGLPDMGEELRGRTALIVSALPEGVTGTALKQLASDQNAVLIAVGATGVETLRAIGRVPRIIVGDTGTVNDEAVRGAAATVLLQRPDGRTAGASHLKEQSISFFRVSTGLDEMEVALLLAAKSGVELIIECSPISNLETLVDAGGSTFNGALFTRAQLAGLVVNVRAALRLQKPGIAGVLLVLMVLVAILAMVAAVLFTPWGADLWMDSSAALNHTSLPDVARF